MAIILPFLVVWHGMRNAESDVPVSRTYSPHPERVAEYAGSPNGFSAEQIRRIACHTGLIVIIKRHFNGDLQRTLGDVGEIDREARRCGNDIRILSQYVMSHWLNQFAEGLKPYSDQFDEDWLLRDHNGRAIPFHGVNRGRAESIGFMINPSNPDYQNWLISTYVHLLQTTPLDGVAFDTTNRMLGPYAHNPVADGRTTFNELMCGARASADTDGNCDRVSGYNAGITELLNRFSTAIHREGGVVNFNGIAAHRLRGESRGLEFLEGTEADSALHENFCYKQTVSAWSNLEAILTPMRAELDLMQEEAQLGKQILQVTNWHNDQRKRRYESFCGAGFLLGWQPGFNWYIYHQNYSFRTVDEYPQFPEIELNLAAPTGQYLASGSLLTREFKHGFVAANDGTEPVSFTLPYDVTEFRGGEGASTYDAGTTQGLFIVGCATL